MSVRYDIQWLHCKDKFITWATEISLYQVVNLSDNCNPYIKISDTCGANLLSNIPHVCYIKCVDVCPRPDNDILLAIAQSNGKILVTTFGYNGLVESQSSYGRELASRYLRQCNAVSWNPIDYTLVGGFDRHRSDHCIVLWDVLKSNLDSIRPDLSRPVAEFGIAEVATSLSWFQNNNKTLVAGMNGKTLKIIDFRDISKAVNSTTTKAVYGVTVDPRNDVQLASHSEAIINIWDTRNFDKPLISLPSRPLHKLSWCPTKPNLLSVLHKDSSVINLYDVQHTVIGNEEIEPSVLERDIPIKVSRSLSSFSWHDSDEYRLLTISSDGSILEYTVMDRLTLNWAPNSNIVWTFGRNTIKCLQPQSKFIEQLDDISHKMKERVLKGYGLEDELYKNGSFVDDETIASVWNWLHLSKELVKGGVLRGQKTNHPGIREILKLDPAMSNKSESVATTISDLGNNSSSKTIRTYKHEDRSNALHLCGTNLHRKSLDNPMPSEREATRAAAIAVFNLKIRLAIDILNRGAEKSEHLNIVSMALAGFSDESTSIWRQFCFPPKFQLQDPYLRVIFAFLTAENYNYDLILFERDIPIVDRVAFACIFLSDTKLHDYIEKMTSELISKGNLDGMLLTGNSVDGIRLLQRYLDITGDIQTTALIAVRAFSGDLLSEIQDWVSSYRNLLDAWKLWNDRARFDIMFTAQNPNDKPPQQVYVSCNFCGKSISAYMQGLTRGRAPFPRMGGTANKLKMSACPNCRKPLPRCVICLMHMGTTTGQAENGDVNDKLAKFANWFTWCQTCRHGGHASHMVHWFKEHSECPVTACTCKCFSLDAVGNDFTFEP